MAYQVVCLHESPLSAFPVLSRSRMYPTDAPRLEPCGSLNTRSSTGRLNQTSVISGPASPLTNRVRPLRSQLRNPRRPQRSSGQRGTFSWQACHGSLRLDSPTCRRRLPQNQTLRVADHMGSAEGSERTGPMELVSRSGGTFGPARTRPPRPVFTNPATRRSHGGNRCNPTTVSSSASTAPKTASGPCGGLSARPTSAVGTVQAVTVYDWPGTEAALLGRARTRTRRRTAAHRGRTRRGRRSRRARLPRDVNRDGGAAW